MLDVLLIAVIIFTSSLILFLLSVGSAFRSELDDDD
jgi:hypothetical protein